MRKEFYATLPHLGCSRSVRHNFSEKGPAMQFGITLKPDISIERIVGLTRQAEGAGFEYGWIFDSHVLWKEPYPLLTLMAANTQRMRLGTCVTNPATRDLTVTASLFATLNLISGGRMELGIGRGDSSRRVCGCGVPQPYFGKGSAARRSTCTPYVGERFTSSLDRGLRPEGPAHGRSSGRRNHPAICRSSSNRVVHGFCERGRSRRRTRCDPH